MIDTIKLIIAGFSGKLEHDDAARKSVWLLSVTGFFALCCLFFAAYISFSRYLDLTGFLPGSRTAAICFTIGIAGFIFFASGFVATYTAEKSLRGKSSIHGGVALFVFIVGIIAGIGDYQMNIDGASDVARQAAGDFQTVDIDQIRSKYVAEIKSKNDQIDRIKDPANPQYKWKGAIIRSGQVEINKLRDEIANIEKIIDSEISQERERIDRYNSQRDGREELTKDRLQVAVRWVYIIQFFLCQLMALLGVKMSEALRIKRGHVQEERTPKKKPKEKMSEREPVPSGSKSGQKGGTGFYDGTTIGFSNERTTPIEKRPKSKKKRTRKVRVPGGHVQGTTIRSDTLETMGKIVAAYNGLRQETGKEPTRAQIAKAAGVSTKTVSRHMSRIKNLNLMDIG